MRALLTFGLTAAFAVAPALTSPFSGFREDQLPIPQIDPPLQPAGWAFAIWGLIYAWLVLSAAFGLWRRRSDADWHAVRAPLIVALAVGVPWLAIANASAIWATVTIWIMAGGAIAALLQAPGRDRWLLRAPVAVFAGWLTAASVVSTGVTAAGYGLVAPPVGWALIGIALAALVAWAVQSRSAEPLYGAAVAWALLGIAARSGTAVPVVTAAALVALVLIAWRAASRARGGARA